MCNKCTSAFHFCGYKTHSIFFCYKKNNSSCKRWYIVLYQKKTRNIWGEKGRSNKEHQMIHCLWKENWVLLLAVLWAIWNYYICTVLLFCVCLLFFPPSLYLWQIITLLVWSSFVCFTLALVFFALPSNFSSLSSSLHKKKIKF